MKTSIDNPFLKQLISGIASKANEGRMTDINWAVLNEGKKKKKSVKEAKPGAEPAADEGEEDLLNSLGGGDEGGADAAGGEAAPDAGGDGAAPTDEKPKGEEPAPKDGEKDPLADPEADGDSEAEVEQEKADATKAKAELEKAKAEKDQAEEEIMKNSHVSLKSQAGVHFLLSKIVNSAFKTNKIDALASEMVGKLKIQTPEDFSNFSQEMSVYKSIPGVHDLLSTMQGMATKQPEADDSEEQTETP